jgi:hypothetical protein
MIVALIALFVALSGASYAALSKNSVGPKQLKTNAVTGIDANEATFGQVPSATSAANATNAGQLDGIDSAAFQRGGERFDDTEDPTPSVAGVSILLLAYETNTAVTNLTDGVPGQVVTIVAGPNVDIADTGFFFLNGAFAPLDINNTLTVIKTSTNAWVEVARSDNT